MRSHDLTQGTREMELRPVPFLLQRSARRVGLFATRVPRRPNSIGLSLVRIERVAPPSLFVRGVDFLDGTPVLDIKPYVAVFDAPQGGPVRCGWFDTVELSAHPKDTTDAVEYPVSTGRNRARSWDIWGASSAGPPRIANSSEEFAVLERST